MTDRRPEEHQDQELLAIVRDALGFDDPVAAETVDMIMTGYDIVNLDVLTADLVHDGAAMAAGQPVRSGDSEHRQLVYQVAEVRISFELGPRAPHVVGRIEPPSVGELILDQPGGQTPVPVDASGAFECSIQPGLPFRLRWAPEQGAAVATGWVE